MQLFVPRLTLRRYCCRYRWPQDNTVQVYVFLSLAAMMGVTNARAAEGSSDYDTLDLIVVGLIVIVALGIVARSAIIRALAPCLAQREARAEQEDQEGVTVGSEGNEAANTDHNRTRTSMTSSQEQKPKPPSLARARAASDLRRQQMTLSDDSVSHHGGLTRAATVSNPLDRTNSRPRPPPLPTPTQQPPSAEAIFAQIARDGGESITAHDLVQWWVSHEPAGTVTSRVPTIQAQLDDAQMEPHDTLDYSDYEYVLEEVRTAEHAEREDDSGKQYVVHTPSGKTDWALPTLNAWLHDLYQSTPPSLVPPAQIESDDEVHV